MLPCPAAHVEHAASDNAGLGQFKEGRLRSADVPRGSPRIETVEVLRPPRSHWTRQPVTTLGVAHGRCLSRTAVTFPPSVLLVAGSARGRAPSRSLRRTWSTLRGFERAQGLTARRTRTEGVSPQPVGRGSWTFCAHVLGHPVPGMPANEAEISVALHARSARSGFRLSRTVDTFCSAFRGWLGWGQDCPARAAPAELAASQRRRDRPRCLDPAARRSSAGSHICLSVGSVAATLSKTPDSSLFAGRLFRRPGHPARSGRPRLDGRRPARGVGDGERADDGCHRPLPG